MSFRFEPSRASRLLAGALVATAALSAPLATLAQAQQQRPAQTPAQPQPAPQAPAQQGQGGQQQTGPVVVQVRPEPTQTEWTKVCGRDPGNNREICYTTRDFVSDQGQAVLAVAVYDVRGDANRIVRFLLPIGLLLQPGSRFAVDQAQPISARFQICFPNGCFAETTVNEAQFNQLRRGNTLNISVQNQAAREVTFQVPMAGFARAFDGPAIDPADLERRQRELQQQMQQREDELRRRLQGDQRPRPALRPRVPDALFACDMKKPAKRPAFLLFGGTRRAQLSLSLRTEYSPSTTSSKNSST